MHTLALTALTALVASSSHAGAGGDPADTPSTPVSPPVTPPKGTAPPEKAPDKAADKSDKVESKPDRPATPADAALLAAMLQLERALGEADPKKRPIVAGDAVRALATLKDPRVVPVLLRLSRSAEEALRLSALGALGAFLDDVSARTRLEETLLPSTPPEDAAVALPALLEAARMFPGAKSVPCPEKHACVDDAVLLRALLAYAEAKDAERPASVVAVGALKDPRALPFLWRLSGGQGSAVRTAALQGLAQQASEKTAKDRLLAVLKDGSDAPGDRSIASTGLADVAGDDVTDAFLDARKVETEDVAKGELDAVLTKRAPAKLAQLKEDEAARLKAEADAPRSFDTQMRVAIAGVAGAGAAVGAAAASSVVADQISPGSGTCYGVWGACAGGASAAAIGWFGLGDQRIDGPQVALAASASVWGAWAGLLVPPTIGSSATKDPRHMVYAGAAGQLIGLTAGTIGAVIAHPSGPDVGEMNATVLGANALTAGILLSLPPSTDARPLFGSLIGATVAGAVGGAALSSKLTLDEHDLLHAGELSGVGLFTGLAAGAAVQAYDPNHPTRIGGIGLIGASSGIALGMTLGQLKLTPSDGGLVYEAWAAAAGGAAGLGGGLFIDALANPTGSSTTTWFGSAALGIALGAGSTAFFPQGIPQDAGDLMLQPLFVGFGLYHGAILAGTANADPRLVAAAAFLTPALASGGLVYAAPYIHASTGDVLMLASMMGFGAYFSSMALLSAAGHGATIAPWDYVLGTSLAMDAGVAGGVALDLTEIDHVGWRTTYIAAVAAGTTLVLSLPGALVAQSTHGTVTVPDVLLASSLIGVGIGFATMPLIDFRIAPDWGLSARPVDKAPTADGVHVTPTVVALQPRTAGEVPLGMGVIGRF